VKGGERKYTSFSVAKGERRLFSLLGAGGDRLGGGGGGGRGGGGRGGVFVGYIKKFQAPKESGGEL